MLGSLAELLASGAMKGDSLELALLCNIVRKVKMGLSSKEALSLETKSNSFLKQSTREEMVSFVRGEEARSIKLQTPKPIYSVTTPQPVLSYPAPAKRLTSLRVRKR